jgi:hypothetical protein
MKLLVRKKDAAANRVTFFVDSLTSTGAEIKEIVAEQTKVPVGAQQLTYTKVDPVTGDQLQLEAEVTVEEGGLWLHFPMRLAPQAVNTSGAS